MHPPIIATMITVCDLSEHQMDVTALQRHLETQTAEGPLQNQHNDQKQAKVVVSQQVEQTFTGQ